MTLFEKYSGYDVEFAKREISCTKDFWTPFARPDGEPDVVLKDIFDTDLDVLKESLAKATSWQFPQVEDVSDHFSAADLDRTLHVVMRYAKRNNIRVLEALDLFGGRKVPVLGAVFGVDDVQELCKTLLKEVRYWSENPVDEEDEPYKSRLAHCFFSLVESEIYVRRGDFAKIFSREFQWISRCDTYPDRNHFFSAVVGKYRTMPLDLNF